MVILEIMYAKAKKRHVPCQTTVRYVRRRRTYVPALDTINEVTEVQEINGELDGVEFEGQASVGPSASSNQNGLKTSETE